MEKAAQEVFDQYNRSVVQVFWKTRDTYYIESMGTGFIVWTFGSQCLIVTCRHCIEGLEFDPAIHKLVVRFSGDADKDLDATKVRGDAARDIAVLHVETDGPPPVPMMFAETVDELPVVHEDIVVALGFCIPERDEDESDDDEYEEESKDEDDSENEDVVFAYPEVPSALPGKIITEPALVINDNVFNEIYKADCGLMAGCSGGPLVYGSKVIGVATHTEFQIERYATPATVRAVFQSWLGLGLDDGSTFEQLLGLSALN